MIPTPAEAMASENRKWLEVVLTLGRSREFEQTLIDAERADATDLAASRLISLAHAAYSIAGQDASGSFGAWYRDMGQRLLCRAVDAAAGLEAAVSRPDGGGMN